ncbi:MAG: shikimate kinase [Peptostreptococcaceae bacterium]|nr:shikimate kinase [Peptostreptococcaceae bacterium]
MKKQIEAIRREIDAVDEEMAVLFLRRMKAVEAVMQAKRNAGVQVLDREREEEIKSRLSDRFDGEGEKEALQEFISCLLTLSKRFQYRRLSEKALVLIGFMGTGKTTVGRLLAEKLCAPFEEIDEQIEKDRGKSIQEIFAAEGENFFRRIEREKIRELYQKILRETRESRSLRRVISCGGGAVLCEENVGNLQKIGYLVLLTADLSSIRQRLSGDRSRPLLLGKKDAQVRDFMKRREAIYRAVNPDIIVDTSGKSPEEISEEILGRLY